VPDDPDDDQVVAAAIAGGADVLCTRDRHLLSEEVIAYRRGCGIEVLGDNERLQRFRRRQDS